MDSGELSLILDEKSLLTEYDQLEHTGNVKLSNLSAVRAHDRSVAELTVQPEDRNVKLVAEVALRASWKTS